MDTRFVRLSIPRMTGAVLLATAIAGVSVRLDAQESQAAQAPVFKSSVELVAIDVNVVDKIGAAGPIPHGGPVHVTVDGRPRRVLSAEAGRPRAAARGKPRGGDGRGGRTGLQLQQSAMAQRPPGRLFYLLVDQGSFKAARATAVIAATRRFVQIVSSRPIVLVSSRSPGPARRSRDDRSRGGPPGAPRHRWPVPNQPLRSRGRATSASRRSTDIGR